MSKTNQFNRQEVMYALVDLGIENIGAGNEVTAKLPQGALVVDVGLYTVTAFNSATTTTGTISDGTTALVDAQDVKTVGSETVAVSKQFYPQGGLITFSLAETGAAATAGRALGYVGYLQLGNSEEIYG